MELTDFYWSSLGFGSSGEDLHLMRGKSSPIGLFDALRVFFKPTATSTPQDGSIAQFLHDHPNATCTFKPTYKATLNAATNDYEGFGVRVNASTGMVSAGAYSGSPALYNFTVMAVLVTDKNDDSSPRARQFLRLHLHNFVAGAWLTPSHLQVPKVLTGFSFSVYAQFDDQTIAELKQPTDVSEWSGDPPDIVRPSGLLKFDEAAPDGSIVNVTARLSEEFKDEHGGDVSAHGVASSYTFPQTVKLVPSSAGYDRRDEVPNFIFLAEGFQVGDEPKFNRMIDLFITALRQKENFKPFDRLVGRMNFWKAFAPSVSRGVTAKYEVYGDQKATPIPAFDDTFIVLNDSPATEDDLIEHQWGPNQVRLYFGLPVLGHMGLAPADVRQYWKQISYLPGALIDRVPDGLINDWKKMGDRRIVDESDTFIGVTYGRSTKARIPSDEDPRLFRMPSQRITRGDLNKFLVPLQYEDENGAMHPIGSVWDSTWDASLNPLGKDFDNVIILLCANFGREQNETGDLFANVIGDRRNYIGIEADPAANTGFAGGRAVKMADLDASRLLEDMPFIPGKTTLLHEIGHSLGLGDEYGESGITKQSKLFQFDGTSGIQADKSQSNVQVKSDLVVTPGGDAIDADKVKWRWHRIEKSAVLAPVSPPAPEAITVNGSQYAIKVRTGQASAFAQEEVVFLRRRKPGESILRDIDYTQISTRYPFATRSPQLVVRFVDEAADQVIVEAVDAATLTGHDLRADFTAECVLYKPLPARAADEFPAAGDFLELTAANILKFMDGTGLPLHEKMDSDGHPDLDFDAEQSPALADITAPLCAKKNRNVVGLYAGGNGYHHGVYHPAGHCIMRNNYQVAEFCSACRYIITDFIDPSEHPETDKQIEEYYPLKEDKPDSPV